MNMILLVLLVALQIADAATTLRAFRAGAHEANKALAWLMERIGTVPALCAAKAFVCAVGLLLALFGGTYGAVGLGVLCAIYGYVAYNNLKAAK